MEFLHHKSYAKLVLVPEADSDIDIRDSDVEETVSGDLSTDSSFDSQEQVIKDVISTETTDETEKTEAGQIMLPAIPIRPIHYIYA